MEYVQKKGFNYAIFGSSGILSDSFRAILEETKSRFILYGRGAHADIFFDIDNEKTWPTEVQADIVIVFAWNTRSRNETLSNSVNFAKHILEISSATKSRPIFISTVSAHRESRSNYGKSKYIAEGFYVDANAQVLKLAFVDTSSAVDEASFTYRALTFLRNMPITIEVEQMPQIPTTFLDNAQNNLFKLIADPKIKMLICAEERVNFSTFFSSGREKIHLKIKLKQLENLIAFLRLIRILPGKIVDRWLSLLDSSFFNQDDSIES